MTVKFTEKQEKPAGKAEESMGKAEGAVGNLVFKEGAGDFPCNVTLEVSMDRETIKELKTSLEKLLKGSGQEGNPALQSPPLLEAEENKMETDISNKRLLTVAEFARYLGIGQTTAREILKRTKLGFRVQINHTVMINKKLLDEYLDSHSF